MLRISNIKLPIDHSEAELRGAIADALGLDAGAIADFRIVRQSIDARKKAQVFFVYNVDVSVEDEDEILRRKGGPQVAVAKEEHYGMPTEAPDALRHRPVIAGAGPCGLMAALVLAQQGYRPILLERGKPADQRSADVNGFWNRGELDPESNALFGEGGAGAFSDGKLTTRIKDRQGRIQKVLRELVAAGAPEEILYQNKAHLGTDLLIGIIQNIRREIVRLGGEVRFETKLAGLVLEDGRLRGAMLDGGEIIRTDSLILAIGHSARDTFLSLHESGVTLSPKPFAIGARIEHPQSLIDRSQYGPSAGHPKLGAADYQLSHRAKNGRSVYTFCMCPGGAVIGTSTEAGMIVTNGMSLHARNASNGNSAILANVRVEDFYGEKASPDDLRENPLAGIDFQRQWEQAAFELGGGEYAAPAQRLGDFMKGRASSAFGMVQPSYLPGVTPADLARCLPDYIIASIREALPVFDRKIKGFAMDDAVLTGVETRSSSPVRIDRDDTGQSLSTPGLFPAGEGAGYAGGIVSAAVDGLRAAEATAHYQSSNSKNTPTE
ncbi:MAG: NAD(P)/FAD-dependent oxidoreductase [Candidatus Sumerlaeia bacterium]